jgi:hypothetical protein
MKNYLVVLIIFCIFACKPKPEFYIDGKPYYTKTRCIERVSETNYEYHYGYDFLTSSYGWHWGDNTTTTCVKTKIDTIAIKIKK